MERALTELVQCLFTATLEVDATHKARLDTLKRWPVLHRCAVLDPGGIADAATVSGSGHDWTTSPLGSVADQIDHLVGLLTAAGFHPWLYRWSDSSDPHPVLTVVVPGLDSFAMVHNAVPVLPTGRAMQRLSEYTSP